MRSWPGAWMASCGAGAGCRGRGMCSPFIEFGREQMAHGRVLLFFRIFGLWDLVRAGEDTLGGLNVSLSSITTNTSASCSSYFSSVYVFSFPLPALALPFAL